MIMMTASMMTTMMMTTTTMMISRPSLNSISEEEHGMQRLLPNHRQQVKIFITKQENHRDQAGPDHDYGDFHDDLMMIS